MKNGILVFLAGLLIACAIVVVKEKKAAAKFANEEAQTAAVTNPAAGIPVAEDEKAEEVLVEDTTPHLTFKGVPITGSLKNYVARMKSAGFRCIDAEPQYAILEGDFAGYTDCSVLVSTLQALNVVSTIAVKFPEKEKWPELSNNYDRIKSLLTQKYGVPASCVEKFTGPFSTDKTLCVKLDKCEYITTFRTELGVIQLSIVTGRDPYVKLVYQDKANSKLVDRQAYDDL